MGADLGCMVYGATHRQQMSSPQTIAACGYRGTSLIRNSHTWTLDLLRRRCARANMEHIRQSRPDFGLDCLTCDIFARSGALALSQPWHM